MENKAEKTETKRARWYMEKGIITCQIPGSVEVFSCALIDLYPNWAKYDDSQLMVIFYGVKQSLSDGVSNKKELALTPKEIIENFTRKWKRWTVERKFHSGERANAASPKATLSLVEQKALELGVSKEIVEKLMAGLRK